MEPLVSVRLGRSSIARSSFVRKLSAMFRVPGVSRAVTKRAVVLVVAVGSLSFALPVTTSARFEAEQLASATQRADRTGDVVQVNDPPPPPAPPPTGLDPMLEDVLDLVNAERAARGLGAVVHQGQLGSAAQLHSEDQARRGVLSHTGSNGSSPGDRIAAAGYDYRGWGENIASGSPSAESVMSAWMNSSGHRRNILNPTYTEIGLGLADTAGGTPYWTQVFAQPRG